MPGTRAVVWSHQWSKGTDYAPPSPVTHQVPGWMLLAGLTQGDQVLGWERGEVHPALGFYSRLRWNVSSLNGFFSSISNWIHTNKSPLLPEQVWEHPGNCDDNRGLGAGVVCNEVGRGKMPVEKHFAVFFQSKRKTKSAFSSFRIRQTWWGVIETNHPPCPNSSKRWRAREAMGSWCLSGEKSCLGLPKMRA